MKFIRTLLIVISILSTNAYGIDCKQHPLYCKVISLQPQINKLWAMEFSTLVSKTAKRYHLDPLRIIAIANQESGIKDIDRCANVILFKAENKQNHGLKEFNVQSACTDIGIFQINISTIQEYNFDILKLKDSLSYQIESHCRVLKDKIKMCSELGEDSWTCYHSKTKSFREEYKRLVDRFY